MSAGPEYDRVEKPFLDQLVSMGWKHTTGSVDNPTVSGRDTFREVLILDDLRKALVRINLDPSGMPWLDEPRVSEAISPLQRPGVHKLMEANRICTDLLLAGTAVDGVEGWEGGRSRPVHYIDWETPENNAFRVVNQFRVDEPGGQAKKFVTPDLVLFVNGIPLVVAECKSPYLSAPMEEAIDQLQRYSNQRSWTDGNEGNEKLFHTNQFVIGTDFDEARVGTIGASAVHYLEWKDTSPVPMAEVAASLGKDVLSNQEKLVAGMLRPAILLDIVRHFMLFETKEGKTIKLVPRYQQFRAVQLATQRLVRGKTRREDGEHDRRGGIVWHTQGSGKSLAMVFLVRKMRSMPELRRFKIVVVTDRKHLQKQLANTTALTGETVQVARKTAKVKELLAERGPGLVFAMIQKYQEREAATGDEETADGDEGIRDELSEVGVFPLLNEDESVLVLVDEAHRSHSSALHANLLKALPNCARIGFTGTPILMGKKQRTHEIFGEFIDRYTIRQSEEDGATVPILYEGRTSDAAVEGGRDMDQLFEDMFQDRTPEELEKIKQKYATRGDVMEASALIADKARDMLRHYVENILPNGFKAQLVAVSRRGAIRYFDALREARDELVEALEALDPELLKIDEEQVSAFSREKQFFVRAHRFLDVIRELEFAPVISSGNNDDPAWKEWTEKAKADERIARFQKRLPPLAMKDLGEKEREQHDPLAFLIVKSMLITGFNAPVEQVMYLDRPIREAELLQAIARVNRTYPKKSAGIVVDYYGVARHLKAALQAYSAEDVEGMLRSLKDEIPKLRDRHARALRFFADHGIPDIADEEACVDLLLRAEFLVKLKQFLVTLDLVLPRPEALPYVSDAKRLTGIQLRARNRYRGGERPIGKDVGEKVRKLIDEHLVSRGIDPTIPPISILDAEFADHVEAERTPRAKASEMEHALRYHIRKHLDEDPEHYNKLSERLDEILAQFKDNWDALVDALKEFVAEVEAGRQSDDTGLDPQTQAPFLGILKQAYAGDGEVAAKDMKRLCSITVELVDHVQQEVRLVGFLKNAHAQEVLHKWVVRFLDDHDLLEWDKLPEVADRVVELAKVNHERLTR
jgi:type I restriction enzyme R subunit